MYALTFSRFENRFLIADPQHFDRQRLEDGAVHLLNALSLQETDSGAGGEGPSVTSAQMWDLLKTCVVRMSRMDLAACCERHDLEGTSSSVPSGVASTDVGRHCVAGFRSAFAESYSGETSQLSDDQKWNVYSDERIRSLATDQ